MRTCARVLKVETQNNKKKIHKNDSNEKRTENTQTQTNLLDCSFFVFDMNKNILRN